MSQKLLLSVSLTVSLAALGGCADFEQNAEAVIQVAQANMAPTQGESVSATKDALDKGIGVGIDLLKKDGGFLNSIHRIVIPTELQKATNLARNAGLGTYVDGFEKSLNAAAEQAVASAMPIFKDAVSKMTISDVVTILTGSDNAATSYFKTTSQKKLVDTFKPIVAKATDRNNVGRLYTQLVTSVRPVAMAAGVSVPAVNLDEYVSNKAVDALFIEIGNQEKKIRENPVERTTAIMKKVFSYYQGKQKTGA
ncbi:MAG: DUF4197 domain-containing protein [Bdellovibrionota bacterium]|nr:MAG: DUF4197 domain-containing protein [Pseudomonadota bacterium]